MEETACAKMKRLIRDQCAKGDSGSLNEAARIVMTTHPSLTREAMETLGGWPSSEPELAALQRVCW